MRRRPRLDFALTGATFSALMLFLGFAAMSSQANLLYGVFGLMIGVLLVSVFISRWVLRKLGMRRNLPDSAIVGTPTIISYELKNNKRYWASLSITIAELDGVEAFTAQPQAYVLHAAPRMTAIVPTRVTPKRRGLHQLGRYQLSTSFPFGFIKRAIEKRHDESLLVYPALAEVDPRLLQQMRSAESTGSTMRPRRGGTDEFYGLKEFRAGENPRYIYWRRSARTGTLVAKEMTRVSPPRILILVDTYCPDGSARKLELIERSIAMAASLASSGLEGGLTIGLAAWSDGWIKIQPGRGKRHRRDVLSALARLAGNKQQDAAAVTAAAIELQETDTTSVLFSPVESEAAAPSARVPGAGAMMIVPAQGVLARRWFRFHPAIDFAHCGPIDPDELE